MDNWVDQTLSKSEAVTFKCDFKILNVSKDFKRFIEICKYFKDFKTFEGFSKNWKIFPEISKDYEGF